MLALAFLLVPPIAQPLLAQALDIGGVELRLEQASAPALAALGSAYELRYEDAMKHWSVYKKRAAGDPFTLVGLLWIKNGVIARISKLYEVREQYDLADVLTTAMHDVQRRGGSLCTTTPQEFSDGRVSSIYTLCGRYELNLSLPSRLSSGAGSGDPVGGGVQVTVPALVRR